MGDLARRRIEFAGSRVDIFYQGEMAGEIVAFLFDHLPQTAPGQSIQADDQGAAASFTYRLVQEAGSKVISLYVGDQKERFSPSLAEMALYVMDRVSYQLAFYSSGGLMLHAGLVSQNGQGILLPGLTGTGKTTLTAWLLSQGCAYLTDEMAYIPFGGERATGFSRPLNLKSTARGLLSDVLDHPIGSGGILSSRWVDMIHPECFGAQMAQPEATLRAMIFPVYRASAQFELRPLSKAQAGLELMHCLINARNLPEHGFDEATRIARSIPAALMVYSKFDQLDGLVERLNEYAG